MGTNFAGMAHPEYEKTASEEALRREIAERAGKAAAAKIAALAAAGKVAMPDDENEPPAAAERLLAYLVTPKHLEETVGDFAEAFALMRERHGTVHAHRWYYWQVFMIGARAAFGAVCKAVKLWNGFGPA